MNEIELGDVVVLKSGSPNMTVEDGPFEDDSYKCVWFIEGEVKEKTFHLYSLEKIA